MTPRFERVWQANPEVGAVLRESPTIGVARKRLFDYLNRQEREFLNHNFNIYALELATTLSSVQVMKSIISVRNEEKTGFSALRQLFDAAHGLVPEEKLTPGFKEEFRHLFRAIRGRSKLYPEWQAVPPKRLSGREAAIVRSGKLDRFSEYVEEHIRRYPTGLDPKVMKRRAENRQRIMVTFGAAESDWNDYRWHLRNVMTDAEALGKAVRLTPEEKQAIKLANEHRIPFGVTPYYASLMDFEPRRVNDHSIRAQVIPSMTYVEMMAENKGKGLHSLDFMQEYDTSPIDLVTRRYPRIAILKPYNTCAQICVYCQRNWEIEQPMAPHAMAPADQIDAAVSWFRDHPGLTEVLVTGGDPLVTGNNFIDRLLDKLSRIRRIERIRIGSRVFVTVPQRITKKLADIIARYHEPGKREMCLVTHIQHVYEVTEETMHAVQEFRKRGIAVYNQMVFTRENSRRFEAVALRRLLRLIGVDPYYTFNTKGKEETVDFRVPIARLRQEQKEEARLMPGLVRTDEAVFNVPGMGKNYVRGTQHHSVIMILPDGRRVYEFHPWEKRISLAPTYVDTDVGIWEYLEWLKSRGEDLKDYRSIWYYY
ncbi:KamA family radical SAM protein [candidate division WOR-3 bacterium JGI_Cruoil_03_51_56]|uniref:KamA family radical SAM protein n=1 Tax=candidate division WOR-3 bacterium JGI_Cruoil_03_51_56 TaxID=1973747 RepID=A0A235BUJ8_UNCW3|nr:MAG: KamA family radical SAM protein [candidate division WOR-3 bacterium JGI_Cruoil_03_51_56]